VVKGQGALRVGSEQLAAHRLTPESPSRRMVAACCETPMFGDFTKGFWISIYRSRVANAPEPSMRAMTDDALEDTTFPDDGLPRFRGRPGKFLIKLLTTWAAMGFAIRGWLAFPTKCLD
jgi:hypothetical protein